MLKNRLLKHIIIYIVVMLSLLLLLSGTCFAENKQIILNSLNIKNYKHIKINNTLYLPVKSIFEAFEWQVCWDKAGKKVVCANGGNKIEFVNESREITVDGDFSLMDSPFIIVNNIGYVPQKFVVQQFGVKVRWNKKDNLVLQSSNNTQSISINGSSNIVIVGEGIIANIFEPCSQNTLNDMLDIADRLLSFSPSEALQKYEEILENFSAEDMPDLYARIMNNMGNAYSTIAEYRDTRENIKKAICSYNKAMEYFKENGDNTSCCTLLINLGNAYRILYEVDNDQKSAENAISLYKETLQYYTAADFPLDYALIQYNMGLSYNRSGAMELAACYWRNARDIYEKTLKIYTLIDNPQTYALIKYNLGNIYRLLPGSDNFDDFEASKQSYEEALKVWTSESFPMYYAKVNTCLGMLYSELYAEDKASGSFENARSRFNESLRFYTFDRYPVNFAKNNLELGNLYILAYKRANDKKIYSDAVLCYENSLKVFTPSDYPKYYNLLVNNMRESDREKRYTNIFTDITQSVLMYISVFQKIPCSSFYDE
ncbi:MAG: stalk domain-containing protein, partial [Bacillota bacterium]|nr:stalk domain-containing protein [Bacillota bacterium]